MCATALTSASLLTEAAAEAELALAAAQVGDERTAATAYVGEDSSAEAEVDAAGGPHMPFSHSTHAVMAIARKIAKAHCVEEVGGKAYLKALCSNKAPETVAKKALLKISADACEIIEKLSIKDECKYGPEFQSALVRGAWRRSRPRRPAPASFCVYVGVKFSVAAAFLYHPLPANPPPYAHTRSACGCQEG